VAPASRCCGVYVNPGALAPGTATPLTLHAYPRLGPAACREKVAGTPTLVTLDTGLDRMMGVTWREAVRLVVEPRVLATTQ
jgi:hypothetical protein